MNKAYVTAAVALMGLAGCANPILRVDMPGSSLARSPAAPAEPASMSEAMQKANHLRAVYYEAIQSQVGAAQNATNGLTWLGAAIAGMATGNVHRDAILGAALVGGTTYGLTQANLDGRRLDIWTAGMEALDCAKNAAMPLNFGPERLKDLRETHLKLDEARTRVQTAASKVKRLAGALQGEADALKAASDAEAIADKALTVQTSLSALLNAARGGELSAAVDRIQTGVTKAIKDTTMGVQAVKQLVAGLGGFAEVLAPGAGVAAQLDAAFASVAKVKAQGGSDPEVAKAMVELNDSLAVLNTTLALAEPLIGNLALSEISAALQQCGVSLPATQLKLEPAQVQFTPGTAASKGLVISGGKPPYMVEALDELPDGLSYTFSGGLADRALVKAAASLAATGEFRLVVTDSGATKRSQQLVIQVGAAGSGGPTNTTESRSMQPVGQAASPAAVAAAWSSLQGALNKGFSRSIQGVTFKVTAAAQLQGGLSVAISCTKLGSLTALDVREQLLKADPAAETTLRNAKVLGDDLSKIDLSASKPCLKA